MPCPRACANARSKMLTTASQTGTVPKHARTPRGRLRGFAATTRPYRAPAARMQRRQLGGRAWLTCLCDTGRGSDLRSSPILAAPARMKSPYAVTLNHLRRVEGACPRAVYAQLRDATSSQGIGMSAVIRGAASSLGLEAVYQHRWRPIERGIATFAREGNGGLIVPASGLALGTSPAT